MRFPWEPAKDDLETRVKRLENDFVAMRLEWHEVLDKLLHRLQRQAKRDRDATVKALDTAPTGTTPGPLFDSPAVQGRSERLAAARARLHAKGRGNGWTTDETRPRRSQDGEVPR